MALVNAVESTDKLLDSQTHVWNHILNFVNSMSLKCAIQLCIPDIIHKHGKPMTLSQLADSLTIEKAKSNGLYRLMRILTHSKFFDKVKICKDEKEEEAYCLTRASRLLLRDEPMSMAPFALAILDPIMMDPWQHVSEWFHNNESSSSFEIKHGRMIWEHTEIDRGFNVLFNEAMASDARLVTRVLTTECRHVFQGLKSMVDVAGGTGATMKKISDAFPGMKCIVLDLPHVVAGLEGGEDLSFVGGDMFESIPHAHAIFLKWILHGWNDEKSVRILKKCKEAISPYDGGKVIIVEMVLDDERDDDGVAVCQLLFDMQLMVQADGKQRTQKEWANIFLAAGFNKYKITPVLGSRSLIEVFP